MVQFAQDLVSTVLFQSNKLNYNDVGLYTEVPCMETNIQVLNYISMPEFIFRAAYHAFQKKIIEAKIFDPSLKVLPNISIQITQYAITF